MRLLFGYCRRHRRPTNRPILLLLFFVFKRTFLHTKLKVSLTSSAPSSKSLSIFNFCFDLVQCCAVLAALLLLLLAYVLYGSHIK